MHPMESIGAAGLGKPAACLAGSGRMIQIAPQIRILVAVEAIDGRTIRATSRTARSRKSSACPDAALPRVSPPAMTKRRRIDVSLEELDQIIDRGQRAPLSESQSLACSEESHPEPAERSSTRR
jgi:hypothetical protein